MVTSSKEGELSVTKHTAPHAFVRNPTLAGKHDSTVAVAFAWRPKQDSQCVTETYKEGTNTTYLGGGQGQGWGS